MLNLLSKKIILALLFATVLLSAVFILKRDREIPFISNINPKNIYEGSDVEVIDSDGDGLSDWEEFLWGTDPENIDSDGDGTPDGEEVKLNRDPNLAGPDDVLEEERLEIKTMTETDRLAAGIMEQYIRAIQGGNVLTSNQKDQIVNSALNQVLSTQSITTDYSLSKLNITKNITVRDYGNNLGRIFIRNGVEENPLTIIKYSIDNRDNVEIKKLVEISNIYKKIEEEVSVLATPREAASLHLSLLVAISEIRQSLILMSKSFEDPVAASKGLTTYYTASNKLIQIFDDYRNLFTRNKIIYQRTDNGYIFFK